MSDQGPSAIQPVSNGAGAPPPEVDASDDELLAKAMEEVGGEDTDAEVDPAELKPKAEAPKEKKDEQKLTEDELEKMAIALTSKKRRLRERAEAFQEEVRRGKGELETERARFEQERSAHSNLMEQAKASPLAALESLGWSYEELQAYVMSEGQIPYEKRIKEIEDRFDKRLTDKAKELEEKQGHLSRQAVMTSAERFKMDSERRVQSLFQAGKFPLAAKMAQAEGESFLWTVLGSISNAYKSSGGKKVLAPDDVLDQIEQRLTRQIQILTGGAPGRAGDVKTSKPEAGKEPRTLTNELGAERAVRTTPSGDDPDDEELMRQALAILTGGD